MRPRPAGEAAASAVEAPDRELWLGVAATVRPLPGRARAALIKEAGQPGTPPPPLRVLIAVQTRELPPLTIGVLPPGLDRASWLRLRRGRVTPERRLDLHGFRADGALEALEAFVAESAADGVRVVEVVTGRGVGAKGGVIRRALPGWLNGPTLRPLLLGVCHPHEANSGAVLLLLRRRRLPPRDPRVPAR